MTVLDPALSYSLPRPALATELAGQLRRMIVEGELEPGEKVPERQITERFGVSRTPVREAIKVLAHEGFVQLLPNRGAIVAPQSTEELHEIFPLVGALEGLAGELAAVKATDDEIAEITEMTGALRTAYEVNDRPTYFHVNEDIHAALLKAARNPTLAQHHASLASRVHRARYSANFSQARWKAAIEEHEDIAEALAKRDSERLGAAMRHHMANKLASLLSVLGQKGSADGAISAD